MILYGLCISCSINEIQLDKYNQLKKNSINSCLEYLKIDSIFRNNKEAYFYKLPFLRNIDLPYLDSNNILSVNNYPKPLNLYKGKAALIITSYEVEEGSEFIINIGLELLVNSEVYSILVLTNVNDEEFTHRTLINKKLHKSDVIFFD
jgi:hypothetical protein